MFIARLHIFGVTFSRAAAAAMDDWNEAEDPYKILELDKGSEVTEAEIRKVSAVHMFAVCAVNQHVRTADGCALDVDVFVMRRSRSPVVAAGLQKTGSDKASRQAKRQPKCCSRIQCNPTSLREGPGPRLQGCLEPAGEVWPCAFLHSPCHVLLLHMVSCRKTHTSISDALAFARFSVTLICSSRAKKARQERQAGDTAKRRKMTEDLERREKAFATDRNEEQAARARLKAGSCQR